MKTLELLQPPAKEGTPPQKIIAIVDHICFVFKPPLQPFFMINISGTLTPCIGSYDDVLRSLEKCNFALFDTPEGSRAAINPAQISFYTSPELGLYGLVCSGAGVTVKATTAEIENLFESKSPIIGA